MKIKAQTKQEFGFHFQRVFFDSCREFEILLSSLYGKDCFFLF